MATPPPGPRSRALAERLRSVESRNVTYLSEDFPVFWEEARGANVRDVDGNVYIDFTGAFGVSFAGHGHPRIQQTLEEQSQRLIHGMGDVHPPALKLLLLERLSTLAPWEETRSVLSSSGSEAMETALKTSELSTGRSGIIAFEGAYHGLTLGSLAVTARPDFRDPFRARLHQGVSFAPYPETDEEAVMALTEVQRLLSEGGVGAVDVEGDMGMCVDTHAFRFQTRVPCRRVDTLPKLTSNTLEMRRCIPPLEFANRRQRRGDAHVVVPVSAGDEHPRRRFHKLSLAHHRRHRVTVGDRLGEDGQVGSNAGKLLHSTQGDAETAGDFVEDEDHLVPARQFAHTPTDPPGLLLQALGLY